MPERSDFSVFDRKEVIDFIFYPRKDWRPPPPGAADHSITVAPGVSLSARFYAAGPGSPSILFFHGNGEVASDYDDIAPLYNSLGINLFVADYRGYGLSGGQPSFSAMLSDAHPIFQHFLGVVQSGGFMGRLFLMGRSLGTASAVELAFHYQGQVEGLIVDSGFASPARMLRHLGFPVASSSLEGVESAGRVRLRSLRLPVLIIHGEGDTLIPAAEASRLYQEVGSENKRLLIIPGAGHNDVMVVGMEQYFSAIKEFVFPR